MGLRASGPSFHGRSSVTFTTNIAEFDFRYTQLGMGQAAELLEEA